MVLELAFPARLVSPRMPTIRRSATHFHLRQLMAPDVLMGALALGLSVLPALLPAEPAMDPRQTTARSVAQGHTCLMVIVYQLTAMVYVKGQME